MSFLGRQFYDCAYIESTVFQMSKFSVFDRCDFMSCQWCSWRHLFPGNYEHNVAPRALQIVVAYAGVNGKTAFLVELLVSINTENVVYNDIVCFMESSNEGLISILLWVL